MLLVNDNSNLYELILLSVMLGILFGCVINSNNAVMLMKVM